MIEITSVKKLKEFLEKYSDDTLIFSQVVAKNGDAWNCFLEAGEFGTPTKICFQMSHPELKVLL